jgi:flagellar biosynthesis protein FlhB
MADQHAQDRSLPASQRKLQKARDEGQLARSRDLSHFASIQAGGAALVLMGPTIASELQRVLAEGLRFDGALLANPAAMGERLASLATAFLSVVLPVGALMIAVAIGAALAAGGWVWTFKPLAPSLAKPNPLAGLPRLLSKRQLGDAMKACALALLLGGSQPSFYLSRHLHTFAGVLGLPLPAALSHAGRTLIGGLAFVVLLLAVFALVDVPLQRHLHVSRWKMSHQEAKQEHKELEGNTEVKSKVKTLMRERANRRMIAAVQSADLVVMNPDALCGGAEIRRVDDGRAARDREGRRSAGDAHPRCRQRPPGAGVAGAAAEIDREIPAALFAAVAQVLAYVYQLRAG